MTDLSFVMGFVSGSSGDAGKVVYDTAFAGKASAEDLTLAVQYMRWHVQAHVIPSQGQIVLGNRSSSEGRVVQSGFCDECHGVLVVDRHGERVCQSCGLVADLANPLSETSAISSQEDDGQFVTEKATDYAGSQKELLLDRQRELITAQRRASVVAFVKAGYNTIKALRQVLGMRPETLREDRKALMDAGVLVERTVGRRTYLSYVPSASQRLVPTRTVEPDMVKPTEVAKHSVPSKVLDMTYVLAAPHAHLYGGVYSRDTFFFAGRMYPAADGNH